jgi:hypothetical protein
MRVALVATAALLAAVPALAQQQSADIYGPRTLKPWMVACTDLPVESMPTYTSVVKGVYVPDGRAMASEGQEIMIGRKPDDGLAIGQRFIIRRPQTVLYGFGTSEEGWGRVRTAGTIVITAIDKDNARATVEFACTPVAIGDYLEPFSEPPMATTATALVEPDFDDRARILVGTDGKALFGDGDTLSIERGTAHGVTLGQRYAFYKDDGHGPPGMPLYYLADGVVLTVNEQTSKVVIVKAIMSVSTADVAVPRRTK